ncbi:MAG TPA: hypothetical protein VHV47_00460 [Opitutaceae bacterium]|nr:hypothetical protein [Opitutaceae bacterium]
MPPRIRLCLALAAPWLVLAAPLSAAWSWSEQVRGSDLWLTAAENGAPRFDLRLGAGGSIAELDLLPGGTNLLAAPFGDNETDRVMQWTLWSDSFSAGGEPFNEDLAGSGDGTFAPVGLVRRNLGTLDVFAEPQDQWDRTLNPQMRAVYPALTRYQPLANGVLAVRRVVLLGQPAGPAAASGRYDVYFEQWNPFRSGPGAFDALALSLDGGGAPNWWYRQNYNVPYYPYFAAGNTFGYALAYREAGWPAAPLAGVAFSTAALRLADSSVASVGGGPVFNSMDWGSQTPGDQGIALLPALQLFSVPSGSVIDFTYYVVLRSGADAALRSDLQALVAAAPAPVLYGPDHLFIGELAPIVATLRRELSQPGVRTNHLAPLLIYAATPP